MRCASLRLMGDKKCGGLWLPFLVRLKRHSASAPSAAMVESREDEGVSTEVTPPAMSAIFRDWPSVSGRSCDSDDAVESFALPAASSSNRGGKTENDGFPSPPLVALLLLLLLRSRLLPATSNLRQAKEVVDSTTELGGNFRLRSTIADTVDDAGDEYDRELPERAVELHSPHRLRRDNCTACASIADVAVRGPPPVMPARALPSDVRIMQVTPARSS